MIYRSEYEDFIRPEFAPVYYPSESEFTNPVDYINRIAAEAKKYGVVKIVPPKVFDPPFAIDPESFKFRPRIQVLNSMDIIIREQILFYHKLQVYWELQGWDIEVPEVEKKTLDLYKLNELVKMYYGFDLVCEYEDWADIAKHMGFTSDKSADRVKDIYQEYVYPYVRNIENKEPETNSEDKIEAQDISAEPVSKARKKKEEDSRRSQDLKSRKTAGKEVKKYGDSRTCMKCDSNKRNEGLLICEDCDKTQHILCSDIIRNAFHKKKEWRCIPCVRRRMRRLKQIDFGFADSYESYNLITFADYANEFKKKYFSLRSAPSRVDIDIVEREYWRNMIDRNPVYVKYGSDLKTSIVGSGFPQEDSDDDEIEDQDSVNDNTRSTEYENYVDHPWNLNNTSLIDQSLLRHVGQDISGMTVPWVYVGMCFSSFCWHVEDHWTYSLNYHHWGDTKVWYGISGDDAPLFEKAVRDIAPNLTKTHRNIFHHMTNVVNPAVLRAHGVKVYTVHQNAGEFVVTFPRAYHSGFNTGLNFAEATNFASVDWLSLGRQCVESYALTRRDCVFSHDELVMNMVEETASLDLITNWTLLAEVKEMLRRELIIRRVLHEKGVRMTREVRFEMLDDDTRTCSHCKTTLFMSAVVCDHIDRITCLRCVKYLCSTCKPNNLQLWYRHTMKSISTAIIPIQYACDEIREWEVGFIRYGVEKKKLSFVEVQQFVQYLLSRNFPLTSSKEILFQIAMQSCRVLDEIQDVRESLNLTMRQEHRLHHSQFVSLEEVKKAKEILKKCLCDTSDFVKMIDMVLERYAKWKKDANIILRYHNVDMYAQHLRKGNELGIRAKEIKILHKMMEVLLKGKDNY